MDSKDAAKSMRGSIGMLAMHWLLAPSTSEQAVEAGMPDGIAGYAVGRLGVLGDCPVEKRKFRPPMFLDGFSPPPLRGGVLALMDPKSDQVEDLRDGLGK